MLLRSLLLGALLYGWAGLLLAQAPLQNDPLAPPKLKAPKMEEPKKSAVRDPNFQLADPDENILDEARIRCDTASLIGLLKKLTPADEQLARVGLLIRQLGSAKFAEREAAAKELVRLGPSVAGALQEAASKNDAAEVRRAAKRSLELLGAGTSPQHILAAVRVLLKRETPDAVPALLGYLPNAANTDIEEEICFGLDGIAQKSCNVPKELLATLTDMHPKRRAIAACIVSNRGTPEQRALAKQLLKDPDPTVRLRTAQGLLAAKDASGVPTLIDLLGDEKFPIAWQAEELLHWAKGTGVGGPTVIVREGGEWATRCRAAWAAWWRDHQTNIDLRSVVKMTRRPSLFMVAKTDEPGFADAVRGCDGTMRWSWAGVTGARTVWQLLPNCHLLATGMPLDLLPRGIDGRPHFDVRYRQFIMEVDMTARTRWRYEVPSEWEFSLVEPIHDGRIHFVVGPHGHGFLSSNGIREFPRIHTGPLLPLNEFQPRSEKPVKSLGMVRAGNRFVCSRSAPIREIDDSGHTVAEIPISFAEDTKIVVIFPLLRLGFQQTVDRTK